MKVTLHSAVTSQPKKTKATAKQRDFFKYRQVIGLRHKQEAVYLILPARDIWTKADIAKELKQAKDTKNNIAFKASMLPESLWKEFASFAEQYEGSFSTEKINGEDHYIFRPCILIT